MGQRVKLDNLTVCYCKKQTDVSFSCICPVKDSEFCHKIFKVVCRSTQLLPHGSTATLTTLWQNSWSITGQTHEKLMSICSFDHKSPNTSSWCSPGLHLEEVRLERAANLRGWLPFCPAVMFLKDKLFLMFDIPGIPVILVLTGGDNLWLGEAVFDLYEITSNESEEWSSQLIWILSNMNYFIYTSHHNKQYCH